MDFNPSLKSSLKKAIKIDYNEINKMPKVSNFFRGEIVTNNNQPKRLSYDKKEILLIIILLPILIYKIMNQIILEKDYIIKKMIAFYLLKKKRE